MKSGRLRWTAICALNVSIEFNIIKRDPLCLFFVVFFLFHNSISRILLKINFTSLPFSLTFYHFFSPLLQFFLIHVVNSLTDSLDDFYTVQAGIGTDIDLLSLSFTSNSVSPRSSGPVSTSHVRSVSIIQCSTVQ